MKKIDINRLEIRLKGVPAHRAREAATGLGHELLEQLRSNPGSLTGEQPVAHLNAGTVKISAGSSGTALRRGMAERIAKTVCSQNKTVKEGS